uniref:ABC transporter ATP-binding protein n=1 Tax=Anaerococcus mediterraneensis TaxID=1870984 RepID=UPI0009305FDE|nr:ABC transporter ATP-binding protein [Anaerococcus mediterraneensis]
MNSKEVLNENVLEVKDLSISFGGLKAVQNVSFNLKRGELLGLIGPNGAGKTTLFNMLSGVYTPTSGEILLDGEKINGLSPDNLSKLGVARTFQNIRLFDNLTVLDNVKLAMNQYMEYGVLTGMLRLPKYWKEENEATEKAKEILRLFDLERYFRAFAGNLPYGAQRKLEIARAMATRPKLLLLDEPAAGMNESETQDLMDSIKIIREKTGVSILLIEHDMNLVLGISERLVVLNYGEILASGDPREVIENEEVVKAYLGS